VTPLNEPAKPRPKSAQLARGTRRYRRHVASAKQWEVLRGAKLGPCRVCSEPASNGVVFGRMHLHHVVARDHHGDDYAVNLVPVCPTCHDRLHVRDAAAARALLAALTDAEYAYMVKRGGEGYAERAYGLRYTRP
jgi:5-methylcytosine-specific restriction endonuclease McrA